ncbi:hypothetical protein BX600DRAFT_466313 [Xylariales sp. PMI_506]|nr:hypothetical protein BX600DRAFT_466313 [Xylariales sp. PMI_506]
MKKSIISLLSTLLLTPAFASPIDERHKHQAPGCAANTSLGVTDDAGFDAFFVTAFTPDTDIDNLEWTRVDTLDANVTSEDRCIDCVCVARNHVTYKTIASGKWWTSWCHDKRAVYPDGEVLLGEAKGTSMTVSSEISLSIPALGDALSATVGWSVTKTKSVNTMQGCHGLASWNGPHGVWWQEYMGWATVRQESQIIFEGGRNCNRPTRSQVTVGNVNWPDPDGTGFREFQYGCRDPQSNAGPWCNFMADSLAQTL